MKSISPSIAFLLLKHVFEKWPLGFGDFGKPVCAFSPCLSLPLIQLGKIKLSVVKTSYFRDFSLLVVAGYFPKSLSQ